jgi:pimeloyl-ACP methyl ester carboxylesterase
MGEQAEIVWVFTDDGVEVAAQLRGPDDAQVGLVIAHGFSLTSADRRLAALAARLADAGRAVYTFDFRGHGRSGGASTLGDREMLDIDAVVRLARQHDHEKIVVIGASMGGFVALRHAALVGGADAVIAISTPAVWGISPRLRARALFAAVHHRVGRRILSARGTTVDTVLPKPLASPADLAPRITIPVAIVHGDKDPYVPTDDAILLHERLGGYRRLVILGGFGHAEAAYTADFAPLVDSLVGDLLLSGTQESQPAP